MLPLEHAADVQGVGALDPGQIVFLCELVLEILKRGNERGSQRRQIRNVNRSVVACRTEYLQWRVGFGLSLPGDGPRIRCGELVDHGRGKHVTLSHGEELVVSVVKDRPESKARIRRTAAEIRFVAGKKRVFIRHVPVYAGDAEVFRGCLAAYEVIDADTRGDEVPGVRSGIKGEHRGGCRIYSAGGGWAVC